MIMKNKKILVELKVVVYDQRKRDSGYGCGVYDRKKEI